MTETQSLGDRIREAREARKISLRQLAREAKISAPYLFDLEYGRRENASPAVLLRLGRCLKVRLT